MVLGHMNYHPDENWQALEVAHEMLFGLKSGSGGEHAVLLSWEWYSKFALRSHLYPLWLSLPGFILKKLPLGTLQGPILLNSMYFMHSLLISMGDIFTYKLTKLLLNTESAIVALMFSLTNEHIIRFIVRTSANGVENSLAIMGLYYFHKLP
jgi:phosphatidylinositol glycan class B